MTTETLLDLNQAIQIKDFTAFHTKISTAWRKDKTPQQLKQVFQSLIDAGWDIGGIKNLQPQFERRTIDENGWLTLRGNYRSKPKNLTFTLTYELEPSGWRLRAIEVSLVDPK